MCLIEEKSFVLAGLPLLHKAIDMVERWPLLADQGEVQHIWPKPIGKESKASRSVPLESNFRKLSKKPGTYRLWKSFLC